MSRWAKGERAQRANAIQAELFELLGGCCAVCEARAPLEIDHPWGRSWIPRKVNRLDRWYRYRREAQAGLVRLLCHDCNDAPEHRPKPQARPPTAHDPF